MAPLPRRLRPDRDRRRGRRLAPPLREWRLEDGTPVLHFDEIDSTNAEAARRAPGGDPTSFWVLADAQTAARARRGRSWSSLEGNLFASYLCRPRMTPERAALSTFAASLAVLDTASALLGGQMERITLKWPNDVLIDGRKVAGILLESAAGRGREVAWLVIGFGINIATSPPAGEIRPGGAVPTSIVEAGGSPLLPKDVLALLGPALGGWMRRIEEDGFEAIRKIWLSRAARRGEVIGAGLASERLEGVFVDVDATGALVLRTRDGSLRQISAADIYFPD
ncbi:MAG: biotin--[acetyl-CoA-carboxylase] ligase [Pseudomonadota bacterium]